MNTSRKSYAEIYRLLRPAAKSMAEILAYSCRVVTYWELYVPMRRTIPKFTSAKFTGAFNTLERRFQVMEITRGFLRDALFTIENPELKLDPGFSLHVLLELASTGRDIEDEFPAQEYWDEINKTGQATRDALLRGYHGGTLLLPPGLVEANPYAEKLFSAAAQLPEYSGSKMA